MIIYKVKNLLNGKHYIGQALEFIKRKRCHISYSKKENPTSYFHRALKKYGINSFDWKILCKCDSKNELDEMEFHYIKQYNSYITNNGYNMTWGGEGVYGRKLCGERNGMYGKTHPNKGKKIHSEEFKKRMRENNPSNKIENRKKISNGLKEFYIKNPNFMKGKIFQKKGKESKLSKEYLIIFPDGKKEIIKGIREFARKNNLKHQGLFSVLRGRQTHHRNFKCERI